MVVVVAVTWHPYPAHNMYEMKKRKCKSKEELERTREAMIEQDGKE